MAAPRTAWLPGGTRRQGLRWLWAWASAAAVGVVAGCGSAPPARPPPGGRVPVPAPLHADADRPVPPSAQAVAIHALGLVGTPYRYGGNTPASGFDCSGLIGYVYWHSAQTQVPRTVQALSGWGRPVPADELRTGDLVVFGSPGRGATHAGIYVGEGRFVHAPSSGGTVRLDRLASRHWSAQVVSFRRP